MDGTHRVRRCAKWQRRVALRAAEECPACGSLRVGRPQTLPPASWAEARRAEDEHTLEVCFLLPPGRSSPVFPTGSFTVTFSV